MRYPTTCPSQGLRGVTFHQLAALLTAGEEHGNHPHGALQAGTISPHFTDEENEAGKGERLARVHTDPVMG